MKKSIYTLFFFMLLTHLCFPQWWTIENLPDSNLYLTDVQYINSDTGFVVGYSWNTNAGVILKTYDQTATFGITYFETGVTFRAIQFIDKSNGWVVGDSGIIYHTTDCGNNWIMQNSGTKESFSSLCFIDQLNGWASTDSIIYRTTNGGIDWIFQSILPEWITQVFFVDQYFGWCSINGGVGKGIESTVYGNIMKTTDGGNNWLQISTDNLNSLYFVNKDTGWAAGVKPELFGGKGMIIKTTDGGSNWIVKDSLNGIWLNDIYFYNNNIGWSVGSMGTILKSNDGGESWIIQDSGTGDILNSVNFINQNEGWVTGFDLLLYTYNGGGVSFIEEEEIDEMPKEFLLSQNYPNPFNPSTKIKYSIPQSSNVTIKVFDILGNEIETLVNEEKPAGTYEVTWYAEGLPSGIYFYRLQTGSFVQTRKMILLK